MATIHLQKSFKSVHRRVIIRTVFIASRQPKGFKMCAVDLTLRDLRAKGLDAEVISPNVAVICVG